MEILNRLNKFYIEFANSFQEERNKKRRVNEDDRR